MNALLPIIIFYKFLRFYITTVEKFKEVNNHNLQPKDAETSSA